MTEVTTDLTLPESFKAQLDEAQTDAAPVVEKPKTKTLTFKGKAFQVPAKPTVAFMAEIEAEHPSLAAKALLGSRQWPKFLELNPDSDDLEAFFEAAGRAYGVAGN